MKQARSKLIGPTAVLLLIPISLLINVSFATVAASLTLVVLAHVLLTVDGLREWRKRRARPDRFADPWWTVSRLVVLMACPGLGWLVLWLGRFLPNNTAIIVYGVVLLIVVPALALVTLGARLRRYRERREAFRENAPRIFIGPYGPKRVGDGAEEPPEALQTWEALPTPESLIDESTRQENRN